MFHYQWRCHQDLIKYKIRRVKLKKKIKKKNFRKKFFIIKMEEFYCKCALLRAK